MLLLFEERYKCARLGQSTALTSPAVIVLKAMPVRRSSHTFDVTLDG